jgi:DNA-binding transcriptional ArsR family regulator
MPTTTKVAKTSSAEMAKALAHPLRLEVLRVLGERIASPNELARELKVDLSSVSYHVKVLREFGCIELVKTEPRRGATEHFYRRTRRGHIDDTDWDELSLPEREGVSDLISQSILVNLLGAQQAKTLDARKDRHLSWLPMNLDEQGFGELGSLLTATLEASFEIQAAAAARLAAADEAGKPAVVGLMGFEAPGSGKARPGSA